MVQTLQDLLDDHTASAGRTLIWLRVAIETPVSIVQENAANLGEKAAGKLAATSNKKLALGVGAALLLLVTSGVCFAWDRLLSEGTMLLYGHSIQATVEMDNRALGNPFSLLNASGSKPTTNCSVIARRYIHTEVECRSEIHGYVRLGQSTDDKTTILKSIAQIENMLQAQRYRSGAFINGDTMTMLVAGTYKGIDWSPGADYEKVAGGYDCVFDTEIAYSNLAHQQPAIIMNLTCNRTFDVLGKPTTQTYSSKSGMFSTVPPAAIQGVEDAKRGV